MWAHAEDLDTLEFALMQVIAYITGPEVDADLADEIIAYFETTHPPFNRHRLAQIGNVLMNREALLKKGARGNPATRPPHSRGREPDSSNTTCTQHGRRSD